MRKYILSTALLILVTVGIFAALSAREQHGLIRLHENNLQEAQQLGSEVGQETTQITVNGEGVGISNYWDDEISLSLESGTVRVSVGSTFEVGSKQYEVLNLWEDERGYAYVSFIEESSNEELSFELQFEDEAVEGAGLWLFAIDDGEDDLALSTETNGEIRMARMNTVGELTSEWVPVAEATDADGQKIADHSHLYNDGYHWIVFSVTSAEESYLLKLNKNFERVFLKKLATGGPTNDMFAVAGEEGIYVGHFLPGIGHTMYQVDSEGNLVDTFPIGGGEFKHSNGASAVPSEDGFSVFAGETLDFRAQGALMKLDYTNAWTEATSTVLVDEENTNVNMTSAVQWNELWIVTARITKSQAVSESGPTLQSDGGEIWRFVFDESGKELTRTLLYYGDDGNRPHMELKDKLLITTWDVGGKSMLRMEMLTELD